MNARIRICDWFMPVSDIFDFNFGDAHIRLPLIIDGSLYHAASWAISVYYAYQRTWKPFNPILGETYEMTNHGGISFIAEQVIFLNSDSAAYSLSRFLVLIT